MAFALERLNDALFVRRREPSENVNGINGLRQSSVGHRFHLAAEQNLVGVDPHFAANFSGDEVIIAGENFDSDTVVAESFDGFGGRVFGRVEKSEIASED